MASTSLQFQPSTELERLRVQRDTVALETQFVKDIQNHLSQIFPAIRKNFDGLVSRFLPETPAIGLTSNQHDFFREIGRRNFLDVAGITAYVPEGLSVPYIDYANELSKASERCVKILPEILSSFTMFLSQLLTQQEMKLSTILNTRRYVTLEQERAHLNERLGKCFTRGSTRTDVTIGNVVNRNADWPDVFRATDAIAIEMNNVDRKALNKQVSESVELINALMAKINRHELSGVTPAVAQNLSDGAYQVASELEFFAAVYYKSMALTASVKRTVQHYHEITKH